MSTPTTIKNALQSIINKANAKTGANDTTVTAAINRLVTGYGTGGDGGGITPTGTKKIEANGNYNISEFEFVDVEVSSTGITPTGTKTITENGEFDVTQYAKALVNVAAQGDMISIKDITISSVLGNGTASETTILTGDPFVAKNYNNDNFLAYMYPLSPVAAAANTAFTILHGNRNIGSSDLTRYGMTLYSSNTTTLTILHMTQKISGQNYNVAFRAKSSGDLDIYVAANRNMQPGNYKLIMTCI